MLLTSGVVCLKALLGVFFLAPDFRTCADDSQGGSFIIMAPCLEVGRKLSGPFLAGFTKRVQVYNGE